MFCTLAEDKNVKIKVEEGRKKSSMIIGIQVKSEWFQQLLYA